MNEVSKKLTNNRPKDLKLTGEDIVITLIMLTGCIGGIVLFYFQSPPIIVALFLAMGVSASVYRFLGGIQGASFTVGTLRLGGTIAVLVGLMMIVNGIMEKQVRVLRVSQESLVGTWRWQWAQGGWDAIFYVSEEKKKLVFEGLVNQYPVEWKDQELIRQKALPRFSISDGKIEITNGGMLRFSCTTIDKMSGQKIKWKTVDPLTPGIIFQGSFVSTYPEHPEWSSSNWGISLFKKID